MNESAKPKTLYYKRSHFATQLPAHYLYSGSHCWLELQRGDVWRVGLTKFATRMLGEMVDGAFQLKEGDTVAIGQIIGWIEGFKAISDVYCVLDGTFAQCNPGLKENITLISQEPYGAGWLYEARGRPDAKCMKVDDYRALLDVTIDRMLEKQKSDQNT